MEKNNYNIQRNIPPLSSEDIRKHQDFDALLKQYKAEESPQATGRTKIRRLWQIAAAAAAIFAGVFIYTSITNQDSENEIYQYLANQTYVNPPLAQAKEAFKTYTLDAYQGGTYSYKSGSKLTIPPQAFLDKSGNIATGEVEIKYREYHDFVDFFLSGIPMEYDSAGVNYVLESAGMIEVYAEQNGERLQMAPEKAIDIELASEINIEDTNNPPSYNIYRLDETNRQWVYQTLDDIEVLGPVERASDILADDDKNLQASLDKELTKIEQDKAQQLSAIEASIPEPAKPVRPTKANPNNIVLDLDFSNANASNTVSSEHAAVSAAQNAITDLQRQYEGTLWELLPNQTEFTESMSSVAWEDARIRPASGQTYTITLINGDRQVNIQAKPVLSGDDYNAAQQDFQAKMAVYQEQMAQREAQLANRKQVLNEAIQLAKQTANKQYEERIAAYKKAGKGQLATDEMFKHKILNRFRIQSFGVWNCDRPLPPYIFAVKGDVSDQHTTKYNGQIGYIVNKNQNTVRRFMVKNNMQVSFDTRGDNLMWVVTPENKLAVYRPEDFDKITAQTKEHDFVLNLVEQQINSEEDARQILQF